MYSNTDNKPWNDEEMSIIAKPTRRAKKELYSNKLHL